MTNSIEVINLSKKYSDKEAVTNINFKMYSYAPIIVFESLSLDQVPCHVTT